MDRVNERVGMKKIGIIASGSSETEASVVLNEGMEKVVKVEDVVLVDNRAGNKVLAVCRKGTGSNDNIKASSFSPGVAYAKSGKKPSSAKEFYGFTLSVIGDVTDGLRQNKLIIAPSSDVLLFDEQDNPMTYLGHGSFTIGYYKEHPNWPVPVNERFIPYHIGIFSVTGGGKSFLARYVIIPLLKKAGYDVLIFDWKGSDYVPYFDAAVPFSEIALDDEVVMSYLTSKMDYFGYSGDYKYRNSIRDALEDIIYEGEWRKQKTDELRVFLDNRVTSVIRSENLDTRGNVSSYGVRYIRKFKKYLKQLKDEDFQNILGGKTPSDIVALAREKHTVVLDISASGKDEKLSIFLSIAKHLRELMEQKETLNIALIIDEGPQYCVDGDSTIQLSDGSLETVETIFHQTSEKGIVGVDPTLRVAENRIIHSYKVYTRRLDITTDRGGRITVSPDTHLLSMESNGVPLWREAESLRKRDYLAYASKLPAPKDSSESPEILYLAGLVASDGCLSLSKYRYGDHINHGCYIELVNKDLELHKKFCDIVELLSGARPRTRAYGGCSYRSRIGSKPLFGMLNSLGIPIGKKNHIDIPPAITTQSNDLVKHYIRGCFDGDGSINLEKRSIRWFTGYEAYASKMRLLLLRFGLNSTLTKTKGYSFSKRKRTETTIYCLSLWGENAVNFVKEIGFSHSKKAEKALRLGRVTYTGLNHGPMDTIPYQGKKLKQLRLKAGIARIPFGMENRREDNEYAMGRASIGHRLSLLQNAGMHPQEYAGLQLIVNSDLTWVKIREINDLGWGFLYDLTTTPNHNFMANGFIVHNCPFMPSGIENETTEVIQQLCALGRSYHLAVVLLSQGIAGEIGINASVRRNLNTQFIGKIHPLDINEASTLLSGLNIDPQFLVSLPEGNFYFLGSMNPSPVPLLISFSIDEGKK